MPPPSGIFVCALNRTMLVSGGVTPLHNPTGLSTSTYLVADVICHLTGGPSISKQGARSLVLWSYLSGPDPSFLVPWIYPLWTAGAS